MAKAQEERRRQSRFPILPPVDCVVRGKGYDAVTAGAPAKLRNLSGGGALVELGRRMAPAAQVVLSLATPAGPLQVEGEVLWAVEGAGTCEGPIYIHGLRFSPAAGPTDPTLEKFFHHIATLRSADPEPADEA